MLNYLHSRELEVYTEVNKSRTKLSWQFSFGFFFSKDVQNVWCMEHLTMGGLCLNGNIHASGVLAHAENNMKLFLSRHKWFGVGVREEGEAAKDING